MFVGIAHFPHSAVDTGVDTISCYNECLPMRKAHHASARLLPFAVVVMLLVTGNAAQRIERHDAVTVETSQRRTR